MTTVQNEHCVRTRVLDHEVLPACKELGIGFVPGSSLGMSYLAGKFMLETVVMSSARSE